MNDLQPWKIWAVTAALVCAILGTTAARVRLQPTGGTSALAAAVNSSIRPTSVTTASDTNNNQNDAYAIYTPHRSFIGAGYVSGQAGAIAPLGNLRYGSEASPAMQADDYQEPQIDVTQQIIGDQGSQADQLAANDGQPTTNWGMPDFYATGDQVRDDMFADVPEDHWEFAAAPDTVQMLTFNIPPRDAYRAALLDLTGTADIRMLDPSVRNAVINAAFNGSYANGTANLLQALGNSYGNAAEQPVELETGAVYPTENLAISGELLVGFGDEQAVVDGARAQAIQAQAQALQAQAQAQLQAAQQQRAEAINAANLGRPYE
jgi:hypothetical protein